MKWNVYYYDINRKKMHVFNIFEHSSFVRYVKLAIKKHKNKKDFAEQLKSELMYFFWAKASGRLLSPLGLAETEKKMQLKLMYIIK